MIYKCTVEVNETQLNDVLPTAKKIIPLYKSQAEAVDIDWIHQNKDMIIGAACEFVWDLYQSTFFNEMILSRNAFYKLVRHELNVMMKVVRLSCDVVRYCFVSKSTSQKSQL